MLLGLIYSVGRTLNSNPVYNVRRNLIQILAVGNLNLTAIWFQREKRASEHPSGKPKSGINLSTNIKWILRIAGNFPTMHKAISTFKRVRLNFRVLYRIVHRTHQNISNSYLISTTTQLNHYNATIYHSVNLKKKPNARVDRKLMWHNSVFGLFCSTLHFCSFGWKSVS